MKKKFILAAAMAAGVSAQAATLYHAGDISNSVTWKASDSHNMTNRVTVLPGATLSIEPGTVIASDGGSLAITSGARIFAKGTKDAPIVFTSVNDDRTTWRPVCQEWGSLAILGEGLIASDRYKGVDIAGNSTEPDGMATRQMEGLVADFDGDPTVLYGGNNDDYDAGTLNYVSFRYGGQVLEESNELNGLSLGGIGRETDIHHVEIMNNVDDGIEIWGGTVCLKYISIWNIGDDSLDCDQGWRGKAQFGLIVQGYSAEAKQGSGYGDNAIEIDGAEDSDAQPVTTSAIYNFTAIGMPASGNNGSDYGTAWRENARVQYRNCVFMDIGDDLIKSEKDGDGGSGYGLSAGQAVFYTKDGVTYTNSITHDVPTLAELFATPYNTYYDNSVGVNPTNLYWTQSSGNLAMMSDSVFYNVADYGEALGLGVATDPDNSAEPVEMPIVKIERAPYFSFTASGKTYDVATVTSLDPRAAGTAVSSVGAAPNDGFFSPVTYRGAFSPNHNWLVGWTAADEFGLIDTTEVSDEIVIDNMELGAAFTFATEDGVSYDVMRTDDLVDPFVKVGEIIGDGSVKSYIDVGLPANGFYKVVAQ